MPLEGASPTCSQDAFGGQRCLDPDPARSSLPVDKLRLEVHEKAGTHYVLENPSGSLLFELPAVEACNMLLALCELVLYGWDVRNPRAVKARLRKHGAVMITLPLGALGAQTQKSDPGLQLGVSCPCGVGSLTVCEHVPNWIAACLFRPCPGFYVKSKVTLCGTAPWLRKLQARMTSTRRPGGLRLVATMLLQTISLGLQKSA